ncbi:MAG: acyl-CoA thioesterase [Gammaproteobacteria bacterium]|nr:acyl-CoA thioesterase [Gammaproteobacteria bacterium]
MPDKQSIPQRADYSHYLPIQTRWNDMDKYGHINNMIYYGYFDTVVTDYLVRVAHLDTDSSPVVGLVIESHCNYHAPVSFPTIVECGLRVGKLGTSSVRYEIGVFAPGETGAGANGHFVHVYVDRQSLTPTPIPNAMRAALAPLVAP